MYRRILRVFALLLLVAPAMPALAVAPAACPTVGIAPTSIPGSGTLGTAYGPVAFSASGGATPYSWAITGGLPQGSGLSIDASGNFSGTPAVSGNFLIDITAIDANGCSGGRAYALNIPPGVVSTVPANTATNVAVNSTVTIDFSESVAAGSGAFSLQCPSGTPVTFNTSASPAAVYTLTPSANLPAGTTCTGTVTAAQITSVVDGEAMTADYTFSFTTVSQPAVTSTTPTNGAANVLASGAIALTFNEAVNAPAGAFAINCGSTQTFTSSGSPGATITLTPSANLPAGSSCTVTAAAAQITDAATSSVHPASDYTFGFTIDSPPTVTSTIPANGATNVPLNNAVSITFSKAVNVTGSAFSLGCPGAVTFVVSTSDNITYALTPSANLPTGATCTGGVTASQVTDTAGTPMSANYTFSFATDTPPTVTSTAPANGATLVPLNSTVSFTFNKAVNVTASAFKLECPSGTPQAFTLSPAPPGGATTFTLTPSAPLPAGTVCTATAVAAQIADLAGTNLATDYVFSFTTIPPPTAINDTYPETVIGNVSVNSALISFSVLTNDTCPTACAITAFDATSANGGTVAMTVSGAGAGQFSYNPAAGFQGTDTFTYTITSSGGSSTATVSMTISGMIWFINNAAGAGDGRLSSPFNSLAAFQAVNDGAVCNALNTPRCHPAANGNIFLYDSATGYTGPVTLLNGQKLIGQDATSSLAAITGLTPGTSSAALPATGGGSPNIVGVTSAGNTVTLGSGNTVWGMTLGNATGTALTGASVGALKVRDLSINTTGAAVSLANGALDAILNSVSSGGGTNGISLSATTGSFDIEGGGASDPTNTTRGRTTAKNGGGTLTLGSGGTIQNATGAGILMSNATNVTLRNMTIQNNGGAGVNTNADGVNVSNGSGLTLDNDLITGQAGNHGVHATGLAGFTLVHTEISGNATSTNNAIAANGVWNVRFDNLTGTSSVEAGLFENTQVNPFGIYQTGSAAATLSVDNSQFSDTATAAPGNVGLQVQMFNTSSTALTVTNSSFLRNFSTGVEMLINDSGGGSLTVGNSTFDANAIDVNLAHQGIGQTVAFNIHDNTMRQTTGGLSNSIAIGLGSLATATTVLQGKIQNNTIGNAGVIGSGSMQGNGIVVTPLGAGKITTAITGNTVVEVSGNDVFNMQPFQFSGKVDLTLTGNTFSVDTTSVNSAYGIDIIAGNDNTDSGTICANMTGNKTTGNGATVGSGLDLVTGVGNPTVQLQGYSGAANDMVAITSYLDGNNTDNPPPATVGVGPPGTIEAAPSNCVTPP